MLAPTRACRDSLSSRQRMRRDREIHRLNLRIVEDMSRGVLVDLLQVGVNVSVDVCVCTPVRVHKNVQARKSGVLQAPSQLLPWTLHMRKRACRHRHPCAARADPPEPLPCANHVTTQRGGGGD